MKREEEEEEEEEEEVFIRKTKARAAARRPRLRRLAQLGGGEASELPPASSLFSHASLSPLTN